MQTAQVSLTHCPGGWRPRAGHLTFLHCLPSPVRWAFAMPTGAPLLRVGAPPPIGGCPGMRPSTPKGWSPGAH